MYNVIKVIKLFFGMEELKTGVSSADGYIWSGKQLKLIKIQKNGEVRSC